jgi:uncharacterized membrane protein YciS (DUF1049 family)
MMNEISKTILSWSSSCLDSTVLGELSSVVTNNYIRLESTKSSVSNMHLTAYRSAQPDLDIWQKNVATVAVTFNTSKTFAIDDIVGVIILQFPFNPQGISENSSNFILFLRDITGSEFNFDINFSIILTNFYPVRYINIEPSFIILQCNRSRFSYFVNASCPHNMKNISLICPENKVGYYNISCPYFKTFPLCTEFNGIDYHKSMYCSVVDYNAFNTTCFCNSSVIKREILKFNSSTNNILISQQYSTSIATTQCSNFSVNYLYINDHFHISYNYSIIYFTISVLSSFLIGLFFFGFYINRSNFEMKLKYTFQINQKRRTLDQFFNELYSELNSNRSLFFYNEFRSNFNVFKLFDHLRIFFCNSKFDMELEDNVIIPWINTIGCNA